MKKLIQRTAVTLMEVLIGAVILILLLGAGWYIFMSGMDRSTETTREVALMVGVRNMVENMVRDVNAAHLFLPVPEGTGSRILLKVVCYSEKSDIKQRVEANMASGGIGAMYPFNLKSEAFQMRISGRVVEYHFDAAKKTVTRKEQVGAIGVRFTGPTQIDKANPVEIGPAPAGLPAARRDIELATDVNEIQIFHTGVDGPTREFKVLTGNDVVDASCIGLVVKAGDPAEGAPTAAGKKVRRPVRVELATKIWSMRRIYDNAYPEYFSSADDDTRF